MKLFLKGLLVYLVVSLALNVLLSGQFLLKYKEDIEANNPESSLLLELILETVLANIYLALLLAIPLTASIIFRKESRTYGKLKVNKSFTLVVLVVIIFSFFLFWTSSYFTVRHQSNQMFLLYNIKSGRSQKDFVSKDLFDIPRLKNYSQLITEKDSTYYLSEINRDEFKRVVNSYIHEDSISIVIGQYDFSDIEIDPDKLKSDSFTNEHSLYPSDEVREYLDELYSYLTFYSEKRAKLTQLITEKRLVFLQATFLFFLGSAIGVLLGDRKLYFLILVVIGSVIPIWYMFVSYIQGKVKAGILKIGQANLIIVAIYSFTLLALTILLRKKEKVVL